MTLSNASSTTEFDVLVTDRRDAATDVVSLTFQRKDGAALPPWTPGAHIDLLLAPDLERQYSLCGDPAEPDRWQVAVLREPEGRGGSAFVHDKLSVGDHLTVRGPRNNFELEHAARYVFIAGGIGITPILPMIAHVEAKGAEWNLWYGGRSSDSMAFRELLSAYGERITLWPADSLGLLPLEQILVARAGSGTRIYCCGPEPLLKAVEEHSAACPGVNLHVERFTARQMAEPVSQDTFRVVCQKSVVTLEVPPDRSVLEVVEDAGLEVDWACRSGTCGACVTRVISGQIEHRDSVLSDEEWAAGQKMTICVSRSQGDELVLDL